MERMVDHMEKQIIENKLYDFFNDKMYSGDAPEIEDVKNFEGYLCTMDNGIVINCTDGTQICLTIQTRQIQRNNGFMERIGGIL